MIGPAIVLAMSIAALVALLRAGQGPLDLAPLLALFCILGSALVLLVGLLRRRVARTGARRIVVVDGSNVMHWRDDTPNLATVARVLRLLEAEGLDPVVGFDANVGYLVEGRWLGAAALSRRLGIPSEQVIVAHKGTPADRILLDLAARTGAAIVTNDRFRDWAEDWPLVREPGRLRRGGWRMGAPMLEPDAVSAGARGEPAAGRAG